MKHSPNDSVSVEEFCITGSGGTPSRSNSDFYGGSIPWVKSGELREAIILDTEEKITEDAIKKSSAKIVPAGAILLAMYGATIGRLAILGVEAATNQAICNIRPDVTVADTRYVYRALEAKVPELIGQASGGAQPNISQEKIRKLRIPLPPLDEQKRIAAILDKADALRRKRRQALALLESLTQSIFLEMFGDPVSNPKGIHKTTLGELIRVKSGNGLTSAEMDDSGEHPVYGGNGINGYHSEYMFDEPQIVIGRVGVYCGAVHITKPMSWVTDNALYVAERRNDLIITYLAVALRMANLNQYAGRAAQPLVSGSRIYPVEVLVPDTMLQLKFEEDLYSISRRSEQLTRSMIGLNSLFASLQHRAFTGQL